MKLFGNKIECPNEVVLVLPRMSENIVFRAKAVQDFDEFNKVCPEPLPPVRVTKSGRREAVLSDPDYVKAMQEYAQLRVSWLVLKSLQATPGLEWETVDMGRPETWNNYLVELKDAGFSVIEINRIISAVFEANSLDEEKLEAARKAFLAGQGTA